MVSIDNQSRTYHFCQLKFLLICLALLGPIFLPVGSPASVMAQESLQESSEKKYLSHKVIHPLPTKRKPLCSSSAIFSNQAKRKLRKANFNVNRGTKENRSRKGENWKTSRNSVESVGN